MPISGEDMLRLFLKHGWIKVRQKGSHAIVKKGLERKNEISF